MLRRLWDVLVPGDVLLADSLTSNFTNIVLFQSRGVELVSRLNKAHRTADFRRGQRLGDDDHITRWNASKVCIAPVKLIVRGVTPCRVAAWAITVRRRL